MSTASTVFPARAKTALLIFSLIWLTACGGGGGGSSTNTEPVDESATVTDGDISSNDIVDSLTVEVNDSHFMSTHFSGSGNCASCHNELTDANGEDVSIESDWSTSMMANSTRDPFWRAKVASEIKRNPQFKEVLDNKCSTCHAPMANVEARFEGSIVELFDEGFLNPQNPYYNHSMDGVSCSACHQIEDNGKLGTLEGFSGNFSIVDLGTSAERTAFGQYTDPAINPMLNNSGFRPKQGEHMSSSAMCATCHNLKTPFVDGAGNIVSLTPESEFPEQMVYTEWENSSFATGSTVTSCQDCHMPKTDNVKISSRPGTLAARDDFSRHTMVGANSTMLDMLSRNKSLLGVTASGFDTAINRTRAMLESAAELEVVSQSLVNNELTVQLRINNRSGHKLPTSFPSRRVYLHFVVRDNAGNILFESGKTNPDGSIQGVDADTDLSRYEPHYEQITREDQVQVYESIMADTDNNVTYTLLRAATYVKDNRIPPTGFDKNNVENDIRVAGTAMDDDNFNSGSDIVTYKVSLPSSEGISFSAELNYQSLAYGHIKDLFQDNDNPEVARFEILFNNSNTIRSETIDIINGVIL
jgi:cytochrome c553